MKVTQATISRYPTIGVNVAVTVQDGKRLRLRASRMWGRQIGVFAHPDGSPFSSTLEQEKELVAQSRTLNDALNYFEFLGAGEYEKN